MTIPPAYGSPGFIEHSFFASAGVAATSIEVMQAALPPGPGIVILRTVQANSVGVSITHGASADGGTWTLRLHRKPAGEPDFTEVATFTFDT